MYTTNYSMGFPTTRTDSLLRITHWQYWWWFWFTYFLVLYYFLILRLFRFRVLKFRPKLATTTRSHGKWGDLIVCLLPISWCANILTNSNLILRMLEWQSESSLFTVRVRGKQWYWVYKFELKTITDILTVPKNIGHNKWFISMFNDIKIADDYLHIIQLRSQNNWVHAYWGSIFERHVKDPNFYVSSPQELLFIDYLKIKDNVKKSNLIKKKLNANFPQFLKNNNLSEDLNKDFYNTANFDLDSIYSKPNLLKLKLFNSVDSLTILNQDKSKSKSLSLESSWFEFDLKLKNLKSIKAGQKVYSTYIFKNFTFYVDEGTDLTEYFDDFNDSKLKEFISSQIFKDKVIGVDLSIPDVVLPKEPNKLNPDYLNFLKNLISLDIKSNYVLNKIIKHQDRYQILNKLLEVNFNDFGFLKQLNLNKNYNFFNASILKGFSGVFGMFMNSNLLKYPQTWYTKFLSDKTGYLQPELRQDVFFDCNILDKNTYFNRVDFASTLYRYLDHPLNKLNTSNLNQETNKVVSLENLYSTKNVNPFFGKTPADIFHKEDPQNFYLNSEVHELFNKFFNRFSFDNFFNSDITDIHRWIKPTDDVKLPARLIKTPLKYTNFNELSINLNKDFKLFRLKFNEDSDIMHHKPLPLSSYLIFKQKRYTRRDKFKGIDIKTSPRNSFNNILKSKRNISDNFFINSGVPKSSDIVDLFIYSYGDFFKSSSKLIKTKKEYTNIINSKIALFDSSISNNKKILLEPKSGEIKDNALKMNPYLIGNQLVVDNIDEVKQNYRAVKHAKNSSEESSNTFGRRLLRTKRTLVLPAHVNITIITNSYDVIHSWFIPGLGLKLDCIPGRATHHMLHIDNVGFYYGQCAEICGRYHHHMPIRICALPFEHFLVWWHTFGLPKMLHLHTKKKVSPSYSSKKYTW